jgi:hypothetical protein
MRTIRAINKAKAWGDNKKTAARVRGAITKAVAILNFNILLFYIVSKTPTTA